MKSVMIYLNKNLNNHTKTILQKHLRKMKIFQQKKILQGNYLGFFLKATNKPAEK